jgi:dTDP-4-amino-4,6-dideoxygalactose transaminase
MSELALFGGNPIRKSEFRSKPHVDEEEIELVARLMKEKRFSRFVGSPIEGTKDFLGKKSKDLVFPGEQVTFLGGEYVRRFEASWSALVGASYSISVNSATTGLTVALLACDIAPGDDVITTPFTFTATAASILSANAIPVFCDVDLETFCLSREALEERCSEFTKAIVPVHWCGNAGDIESLARLAKDRGMRLIEDAAQCPGSKYEGKSLGTFGDCGVFSFNEPKNVMVGEGGIVVTNSQSVAVKSRLIRNHGEAVVDNSSSDYELINTIGCNYRLVEILAAIGEKQVQKIEWLNGIRWNNYQYLRDKLVEEFGEYIVPQRITNIDSYHSYTAAFRWLSRKSGIHRDLVVRALIAEGIPVAPGIPRLLFEHPHMRRMIGFGSGSFPWSMGKNDSSYYVNENFPNAKKLLHEEYFGFFQLGWPNEVGDMEDILRAFRKILANKDELISKSKEMIKVQNYYVLGR